MADPFASLWTDFGPQAPRRVTEAQRAEHGASVMGFLGNLVAGAADTVTGLTTLVSGLGGDVENVLGSAVQGKMPHNLFVPRFLSNLPSALASDYGRRYDPRHILGSFYNDPLSYVFDAAAGGDIAVRAAEKGLIGGDLARSILPGETPILQNPSIYTKSPEVVRIADARNPFKRFLVNAPHRVTEALGGQVTVGGRTIPIPRVTYAPIDSLEQELGTLQALKDSGGKIQPAQEARLNLLDNAVKQARNEGALYFQTPRYATNAVKKWTMKVVSDHISGTFYERKKIAANIEQSLQGLGAYDEPTIKNFLTHAVFGIDDAHLHQWQPQELIGQLNNAGFRDLGDAQAAVAGGMDPRLGSLGWDEVAALRRSLGMENAGYQRWQRPLPIQDTSLPLQATQPFSTPEELYAAAQNERVPFTDALRQTFNTDQIDAKIKPMGRLTQKAEHQGMLPTDALRARLIIPSWADVNQELGKLGSKFQVVGVEDTRALPRDTGWRGMVATVQLPSGMLSEVEIGTQRWAAARDAFASTDHAIETNAQEIGALDAALRGPQAAEMTPPQIDRLNKRLVHLQRQNEFFHRQSQANWEHISDEIAKQHLGLSIPGGVQREVLGDYRTATWMSATKPMVDAGTIDAAGAFERAYLPQRLASGARWEPGAGPEGMGDFVGGLTSEEIHAQRMAQDLPMPVYYPFFDSTKITPMDFLTRHNWQGGLRQAEKPGFLKRAKGKLFLEDRYVTDPKDALLRRSMAAIRLRDTVDLYKKVIGEFGRPVDHSSQVMEGERLTFPRGSLAFFSAKIGMTDKMLAKIADSGSLSDDQLAAILESGVLDHQRRVVAVTKNGVQAYAVPEMVAKQFERHVMAPLPENGFRLFWDAPHKLWRSLVLTARPAWVANNILGSAMFTKMQGGSLTRVLRQVDPAFRRAMSEAIPEDLRHLVEPGLFAAEGPESMAHLGSAANSTTGQVYEAISNTWHSNRTFKRISKMGERMRYFNQQVEAAFRREAFLTAAEKQKAIGDTTNAMNRFRTSYDQLREIAKNGIEEGAARKAIDEVNYFHNDYNALGPIERSHVRRFIMPFYSFYKHITQLALRYPFDYGSRNLVITKASALANEMMREQYGQMPAWLRGGSPMGNVVPGQDTSYFLGTAINPFSTLLGITDIFTGNYSTPLSLMYPMPKIAYEEFTGQSTFTGREFTDANVVTPFGLSPVNIQTGREQDRTAPGLLEEIFQQVPLYNMAKQLAAGGRTYDTETLASILAARVTGNSPLAAGATGKTLPVNALDVLLKYGLSLGGHPYDLTGYQGQQQKQLLEALRQAARTRA